LFLGVEYISSSFFGEVKISPFQGIVSVYKARYIYVVIIFINYKVNSS